MLATRQVNAAYPFLQTTDFSSYHAQAQGGGARVIALTNPGDDAIVGADQAHGIGLTQGVARSLVLLGSLPMGMHSRPTWANACF